MAVGDGIRTESELLKDSSDFGNDGNDRLWRCLPWRSKRSSKLEADRKARLGAGADQPHRIKYRHLTR